MAHLSHNLKATVQHLGPFAMFVAETYLLDHVVTQRIYTKYTSAGPFTSHSLKMIMNAQLPPKKVSRLVAPRHKNWERYCSMLGLSMMERGEKSGFDAMCEHTYEKSV